jgi:hypothetical protein
MTVRLEHANLTVRDINGMIGFLHTAFPEFRVRGEGKSRGKLADVLAVETEITRFGVRLSAWKPREKTW